jgi:hypothetical protein
MRDMRRFGIRFSRCFDRERVGIDYVLLFSFSTRLNKRLQLTLNIKIWIAQQVF